jgi:hypothetical protein
MSAPASGTSDRNTSSGQPHRQGDVMAHRHWLNQPESPYGPEVLARQVSAQRREDWYRRLNMQAAICGVTWIPTTGYVYTHPDVKPEVLDAFLAALVRTCPPEHNLRTWERIPDDLVRAVSGR